MSFFLLRVVLELRLRYWHYRTEPFFRGTSIGADGQTIGEVVFNTAMTGYQEILTDPFLLPPDRHADLSAYRQYRHQQRRHGVVEDPCVGPDYSRQHHAHEQLALRAIVQRVPAAGRYGRDCRYRYPQADAHHPRERCAVGLHHDRATRRSRPRSSTRGKFPGIAGMDLAKFVTTESPYQWCHGTTFGRKPLVMSRRIAPYHVVAYDFGVKRNILRLLSDLDCRMTVVPATTPAEEVLALSPDGHLPVERARRSRNPATTRSRPSRLFSRRRFPYSVSAWATSSWRWPAARRPRR